VGFDAPAVDLDSPEETTRVGAWIEIVNLGRQTGVLKDVKSNEGERALSVAAVEADVLAVHETNIPLPVQRLA
jgi:hypothetical protein